MKLAYGIFYTKDIVVTRKFYEKMIGLKVAFGDDKFVAFEIGDSLLAIKKASEKREMPGHQTIIISVPDIDDTYAKLKEANISIYKELTEEEWGKNFAVLDPDGNKVEFTSE